MINSQRLRHMKNRPLPPRPLLLAGALCLSAGGLTSAAQDLYDAAERSGWFMRMDAVARFNVKASVKTLPVPAGPGIYDDGTVQPDVSGPASGLTWNWSYQSATQVTYDANNQPAALVFHRLDNVPVISRDLNLANPMVEGEVVGGYRSDDFLIGKRKARIGFEIGYGYFSSSQAMNFQASGNTTLTIDAYGLAGVIPPVPPYAGTFHGPGPVIDLNRDPANSSVNTFFSTTTFQSSLDATFHNFRVGPSFSIDLSRRLSLQIGAGYDSLYTSAELSYLETSAYTPNPSAVNLRQAKWRPGIYAEILVNVQLTSHLQLFLGGDFQHNNDLKFSDSRHEFAIELGSTYAGKGGLSYSF
jgi:hypothetical protein